jgi:hypothetical protein
MAGSLSNCDYLWSEVPTTVEEGVQVAASALTKPKLKDLPQLDFNLHPKQLRALNSPATEILYGGAAGGGKSHLMRTAAIQWCAQIPNLQVYLFRRISEDLHKNHMVGPTAFPEMLGPWIEAGLVKITGSPAVVHFLFNGAKIHLCHCQYESDRLKYLGAEIHVLLVDELTTFTDTIYKFLRGRVRLGGLNIPEPFQGLFPRILCGSNPGQIGHNWVKEAFRPTTHPFKIWKTGKKEGGMMRQFIPALLKDNPTMEEGYAEKLEGLGSAHLVRAMLDGDWDIVAGGMFDDLWRLDKHVIPATAIPMGWKVDRSFDYGSSKPFAVCWWAESNGDPLVYSDGSYINCPKGTVIHFNEFYGWNGEPNHGSRMLMKEVAKKIKEKEEAMIESTLIASKPASGPADSSIFTVEDGHCIADEMTTAGIAWTTANKSPGSRKAGWEKIRRMLKASSQRPMEEPGLLVFDTCRHFIRTVPVLPRDPKDEDDVDTDAEDHIGDAARYRLVTTLGEVGSTRIF